MFNKSLYPISTVAELTGIKTITLRAWERRYGFLNPCRSEKGRRLYSQKDVEKINAVKQLLNQGIAISHAVEKINTENSTDIENGEHEGVWQQYQHTILEAITNFDEKLLDDAYHDVTGLYPIDLVTQNLIIPLLYRLGEKWEAREGSIAEEHFFSAYLRNKLGARFHHQNRLNQGTPVIIAGLPGDNHEFGILLFALSMLNRKMRVLLLGPNLPLRELRYTLHKINASIVVLAGSHDIAIKKLIRELSELKQDCQISIAIGGQIAEKYSDEILNSGLHPLVGDLSSTIDEIENIITDTKNKGTQL